MALSGCSLNVFVIVFVFVFVFVFDVVFFGHVIFSHHSEQISQRSQVSGISLTESHIELSSDCVWTAKKVCVI